MTGGEPAMYRQIANDMRARIRGGEFAPGSRLPSRDVLKGRYGVAGATLDKGLALVREIETRRGLGKFVRDPLPGEEDDLSEYDTIMGRIDELAEEVRQLRGEVASLRQGREA